MSRATLEQDKKKTRAKDGPGAETDRKEREEYGEETDELEDDVPQGGRMSLLAHLNELRRRLTICAVCFLVGVALCLSRRSGSPTCCSPGERTSPLCTLHRLS